MKSTRDCHPPTATRARALPAHSNGCRNSEEIPGRKDIGTLPARWRSLRGGQAESRQDSMVSQVCCSGRVEVHHTARGLCSSWRRITVKRGRQSSSTQVPGDYGHGYRALLRPATSNLVVYPCITDCYQMIVRQAGLTPATTEGRRFLSGDQFSGRFKAGAPKAR